MKFITITLSTAILFSVMAAGVLFYKETICRQKAWKTSFEMKTRSLLSQKSDSEKLPILACKVLVTKKKEKITWQKFPSLKKNSFKVQVKGSL